MIQITHFDEIKAAISGRDEFVIKHDSINGWYIVNYNVNFESTFRDPDPIRQKLLMECRGITFHEDGSVAARKWHKFFNLGEHETSRIENINWNQNHLVYEKLDGSMITPVYSVKTNRIVWCTKMGETDFSKFVKDFVEKNSGYQNFASYCILNGLTPMFEFCSRKNRVVIDYPEDRLVLLGIRHNLSGEYMDYEDMKWLIEQYNIELVNIFGHVKDLEKFIGEAKSMTNFEGYVISDGQNRYKVKADQYVLLHRTMDDLTREKDLINLIINNSLDDVNNMLAPDVVEKIDSFSKDFFENIKVTIKNVYDNFVQFKTKPNYFFENDKKNFALSVNDGVVGPLKQIYFKLYDHTDVNLESVEKLVLETILGFTKKQKSIDENRAYWGGIVWDDYYHPTQD